MTESRGDDAGARARAAEQRASELADRLRRLRAGEPATAHDVEVAEQAAATERANSVDAHRRAGEAHRRAAKSHRQAASVLDAAGHAVEAEEHRRRAVLDDDAALADDHHTTDRTG